VVILINADKTLISCVDLTNTNNDYEELKSTTYICSAINIPD